MTPWQRVRARVAPDGILVRFAPERRLALAIAVTAPLWLLPGQAGTVAGAGALTLLLVAAAVDVVLLPTRKSLVITREAPPRIGIGDTSTAAIVVQSAWPRALELVLADELPPALSGGVAPDLVAVGAAGSRRVEFGITGKARGPAPLGRIGARARTRLGLVGARFGFTPGDEVLVVPSVSGVKRFRLLAMQHRLEIAGVRALRRRGEGQGFERLREYVVGDDPRHLDWKASARRGKLITRQYTIERAQTVLTLIDAGRGMTQLAGEFSRFELSLSSALVLTDIAASAGDRVGTLVFDDEVRAFVPPVKSQGALQAVRDALIPVVATSREPDYAAAFRFLAAHQRKRALVIFYTDVIERRASQALIAHVTRSAARHLAVVVALRNDALMAAAHPAAGGTTLSLYETASAEELIAARAEALEVMRRAGVIVLDVSPHQMTAAVVNRYLELKSRGAL